MEGVRLLAACRDMTSFKMFTYGFFADCKAATYRELTTWAGQAALPGYGVTVAASILMRKWPCRDGRI